MPQLGVPGEALGRDIRPVPNRELVQEGGQPLSGGSILGPRRAPLICTLVVCGGVPRLLLGQERQRSRWGHLGSLQSTEHVLAMNKPLSNYNKQVCNMPLVRALPEQQTTTRKSVEFNLAPARKTRQRIQCC